MLTYFKFLEYNQGTNSYTEVYTANVSIVPEYTLHSKHFPEPDEFTIKIFGTDAIHLVPTSKFDNTFLKPLIVQGISVTGNKSTIDFTRFVISRQYIEFAGGDNQNYCEFLCSDVKYFLEKKLIVPNTDFPDVGDDLPEGFATYVSNDTVLGHLDWFITKSITNPVDITYGSLTNVPNPNRKIRGLGEVILDISDTEYYDISSDITYISDVISSILEYSDINLKFHTYFDNNTKLVNLLITDRVEKPEDIFNDVFAVSESTYGYVTSNNYIFCHGYGNNYRNDFILDTIDTSTTEFVEDYTDSSGQNPDYLRTRSLSRIMKEVKNNHFTNLKVTSTTLNSSLLVGDIGYVNGERYKVLEIQQTESSDSYEYDVSIERMG